MYPSPYIRFKSLRIEREWFAGSNSSDRMPNLHPALYVAVLAAAYWHFRRTGKPAVLTHLIRSREEQRKIYPDKPNVRSVHEFGRGADLRVTDLEEMARIEWENWINQNFEYRSAKQGPRTAIIHQVGSLGEHLHIQIGPLEPSPHIPDTFIQT